MLVHEEMGMDYFETGELPHVTSDVDRFLVNPEGDTDGLVLANGLEVHFPPGISAEVVATVRAGDRVTIHGRVPRATASLDAVSIVTQDGTRIVGPVGKALI
jgi:hypothetical protein